MCSNAVEVFKSIFYLILVVRKHISAAMAVLSPTSVAKREKKAVFHSVFVLFSPRFFRRSFESGRMNLYRSFGFTNFPLPETVRCEWSF